MNRTVLITGASAGIGRALAVRYAHEGDRVLLLARSTELLLDVKREIETLGGKAHAFPCDVADYEDVRRTMISLFESIGAVDIAILNAGLGGPEEMENITAKGIRKVFEVNVFGVAHFLEFLIPHMRERRSGIIAGVGSLADARGFSDSGAYCASKIALRHLLEAIRIELTPLGIRVVTIRPGFVRTAMTSRNAFFMPFLLEPEHAANIIFRKMERGVVSIEFPWLLAYLSSLSRFVPRVIFDWVMRRRRKSRF